tara:strand:+ start:77 stop:1525 length:1449 start_codon:yes stop_codon:yes gene_type:complete
VSDGKGIPENLRELTRRLLSSTPLARWHKSTHKFFARAQKGEPFAVACSGGADSTFTLLLSYAILGSRIKVLHLNHGLRACDSDADEEFVIALADSLGIEAICSKCPPGTRSDEGFLHRKRVDFFLSTMSERSIRYLIQGHNLDDVAETMLWRISRGASPEGLSAPRPVSIQQKGKRLFLRPFITVSSEYIRENLLAYGIPFVVDKTNASTMHLRNRLRKNTVPSWKADSDRNVLKGVARSRDELEEANDALDQWADELEQAFSLEEELELRPLRKLPRAMRRKIIFRWLSNKGAAPSGKLMDQILDKLQEAAHFKINLSEDLSLFLNEERIEVLSHEKSTPLGWLIHSLPTGGRMILPGKQILRAEFPNTSRSKIKSICMGQIDQEVEAWIDQGKIPDGKLFIRRREPGDLFQPIGSFGQKKVKDWMIDRKWSQLRKECTPMIVDKNAQILWIPGFAPSESVKLDDTSNRVIRLTYAIAPT